MNRRQFIADTLGGLAATAVPGLLAAEVHRRPPNFILILCDDMGYGDIGPFGGSIPTPALDRMAREGVVATDYYCPANICTPSRAGLLTGRYPVRTGLGYEVILYDDNRVLPHSEKTIADALKPLYATGLFGKWHLGHTGNSWLPTNYGFDRFFGIPYSHDILPLPVWDADAKSGKATSSPANFPLLEQQFYREAERFIVDNRDRPFFVELALSSPHLPNHPPPEFRASSKAGLYGDCVREIDSIVERLFAKLRELGLDQDTFVFFTSDNGPWFEGSAGRLRDRKGGASYDGGYRVPFIAWAPGKIPPGTRTDAILSGIDFLPTFCSLAGLKPPEGVQLDGLDVSRVLLNGASSPHEQILLFNNEDVVAIRTQRWKYDTQAYYRGLATDLEKRGEDLTEVFDMTQDVSESYSLAANQPEVMRDMKVRMAKAREAYAPFKKGMPPNIKKMTQQMLQHMQD